MALTKAHNRMIADGPTANTVEYTNTALGLNNSNADAALSVLEARTHSASMREVNTFDPILDRVSPKVVVLEPWNLTSFGGWLDRTTGAAGVLTEAHIRAWVDQQYDAGYRIIWSIYVEIFGVWFTRPNFTKWYDYDATSNGVDQSTQTANDGDYDLIGVVIDQARVRGMGVWLGTGRVGLFTLLEDIHAGTAGYGLASIAAEKTLAADRTRQLVDDLETRFAAYDNVIGYTIGWEPSYVKEFCDDFAEMVTVDSGTHPALNTYGKNIGVAMARAGDIPALTDAQSVKNTFAASLVASGFQTWITQAGSGAGLAGSVYTFQPRDSLTEIASFYERVNEILGLANAAANNYGKGIENYAIVEDWRMGDYPEVSLSLSATSGTAVVVTFGADPSSVNLTPNRWIAAGTGIGKITVNNYPTSVTVDTTATGGRSFDASTYVANGAFVDSWSVAGDTAGNQYAWPIPAKLLRVQAESEIAARFNSSIIDYGGGTFSIGDTLPLKLPDSKNGRTAYRAEANTLFSGKVSVRNAGVRRAQQSRYSVNTPTAFEPVVVGTLAGGSYNTPLFTYAPKLSYSTGIITIKVSAYRGETVSGYVNDMSLQLLINGVATGPLLFAGGKNGVFSGTFELDDKYVHQGLPFTIGVNISYQTVMGHPTVASVGCTVTEYLP